MMPWWRTACAGMTITGTNVCTPPTIAGQRAMRVMPMNKLCNRPATQMNKKRSAISTMDVTAADHGANTKLAPQLGHVPNARKQARSNTGKPGLCSWQEGQAVRIRNISNDAVEKSDFHIF